MANPRLNPMNIMFEWDLEFKNHIHDYTINRKSFIPSEIDG